MALKLSELGEAGKLVSLSGSIGMEAEDYRYEMLASTRERLRLRGRFDLNARGYVWDPRFVVFDAGVTLQDETVRTREAGLDGDTGVDTLGYRFSTTWFGGRPNPLTIYANSSQSTVADFWTPSYELSTRSEGMRWGLDNRWVGRTGFYVDHTVSESRSTAVPRSEENLSLGLDANRTIRAQQWGESALSYGYRHTAWDEKVYGSSHRQNHLYLNDRSLFGEKATLTANLTFYDRSDDWGRVLSGAHGLDSQFLGFNSMLNVQQTDMLRHYYTLGFSMSDVGSSRSVSQNLSGGLSYRFNRVWQASGMLGVNATRSEWAQSFPSASGSQNSSSLTGSAALTYADSFGNFLVTGGYSLALAQSDTFSTTAGLPDQRYTTHSVDLGYTRTGSPRYADSLQLRMSRTVGEPSGDELNARYSVTSTLSQQNLLQGSAEYRRYRQEYAAWSALAPLPDAYSYVMTDTQSARVEVGWLHRFSQSGSVMLSAGLTSGTSQGVSLDTRYAQARGNVILRGNLHWTALLRAEQIEGTAYTAGDKLTVESDLNYRIGKWQATARYRYRDARQDFAPFKERSMTVMLKRDYDLRF